MLTKSTLTALFAVIALGLVSAAHGAMAQTAADTISVKVSVDDLNLNSQAGAQMAVLRIRSAARSICGAEPTNPLDLKRSYDPCVSGITDRAVARLHSSTVSSANAKTQALASAR